MHSFGSGDVPLSIGLGHTASTDRAVDLLAEVSRRRADRRANAVRALIGKAVEVFGPGAVTASYARRDADTGLERVVVAVSAPVNATEALLQGESELHHYLIADFEEVEEDIVLLCSRA